MNYNLAYRVGFHPWEDAASDPPFVSIEQPAAFLDARRAELDGGSPVHRRKQS